jgi:hypothetical protein
LGGVSILGWQPTLTIVSSDTGRKIFLSIVLKDPFFAKNRFNLLMGSGPVC